MSSLERIIYQYNHKLSKKIVNKSTAYDDSEAKKREAQRVEEDAQAIEKLLRR